MRKLSARFFQTIREGTCFFFEVWWLLVNFWFSIFVGHPSPYTNCQQTQPKAKKLGVSRGVVVLVGLLDRVDWFAQLCLDGKEVDLWCRGMDGMVGGNGPWLVILRLVFCWMKMATGHILGKTLENLGQQGPLKSESFLLCRTRRWTAKVIRSKLRNCYRHVKLSGKLGLKKSHRRWSPVGSNWKCRQRCSGGCRVSQPSLWWMNELGWRNPLLNLFRI